MGGTLYDVLGVEPGAGAEDLLRAFRKRATELHPDHNASEWAADAMVELNAAWNVLHDPERRAAYDRSLASGSRAGHDPAGGESEMVTEPSETFIDVTPAGERLRWALVICTVLVIVVLVTMALLGIHGSDGMAPDNGGYN